MISGPTRPNLLVAAIWRNFSTIDAIVLVAPVAVVRLASVVFGHSYNRLRPTVATYYRFVYFHMNMLLICIVQHFLDSVAVLDLVPDFVSVAFAVATVEIAAAVIAAGKNNTPKFVPNLAIDSASHYQNKSVEYFAYLRCCVKWLQKRYLRFFVNVSLYNGTRIFPTQ